MAEGRIFFTFYMSFKTHNTSVHLRKIFLIFSHFCPSLKRPCNLKFQVSRSTKYINIIKYNSYESSSLILIFWKDMIALFDEQIHLGFYSYINIDQHTFIKHINGRSTVLAWRTRTSEVCFHASSKIRVICTNFMVLFCPFWPLKASVLITIKEEYGQNLLLCSLEEIN